ncbi:MAG TPA: hypothetical protein VIK60_00225 [Vicinamibacterales bacterium]
MTRDLPISTIGDINTLLELWERGLEQSAAMRGNVVLEAADGRAAPARTLGERNVRLLELHARLFGQHVDLLSHCPFCGTPAQFSSECDVLTALMPRGDAEALHRVETEGHVIDFRLPDIAALAEAPHEETADDFVRRLLDRCVVACARNGESVGIHEAPDAVLDAVSRRMEALDPAARVSFALDCPQCDARWDAQLDVGQLVWTKLQAAAERLLLDVDTLARAYGWTERDVLALSPLRRAAYVQIVNG